MILLDASAMKRLPQTIERCLFYYKPNTLSHRITTLIIPDLFLDDNQLNQLSKFYISIPLSISTSLYLYSILALPIFH